ncbi:MAG: family 20 glycosylhydrolase, partial [Clostridia bacterium]|nr:family 20 glycosylhydrolase [Clostridia bacterium]
MKNKFRLLLLACLAIVLVAALAVFAFATTTAETVLASLNGVAPTIADGKIVLPAPSAEGYEVSLFGSSNESVIALDGTVYTPLVDTEVELMYKVTNTADSTDTATALTASCSITVSGEYSVSASDNAEPQVLPKLREWKGLTGTVTVTADSRIIIEDESRAALAEMIGQYITDITGFELGTVIASTPVAGDIVLTASSDTELGDEGYTVTLGEYIEISAPTNKGLLYGGTNVAQMLTLYEGYALPCGIIRDYPQLEVRSIMLDVARVYIPLDYLGEISRYMAYYKLNRMSVHINDVGGEQTCCFRLESKLYPEINTGVPADEIYSQEDYRAFQKNALNYGVEVVTEIDTPAHAGFVKLYDSTLMLDNSHIDLSGENYDRSVAFIKSLLDELLDGDDPVIVGDRFNVGMDEYTADHSALLKYMKDITDHLLAKGITPEAWGAVKAGDFTSGAELASTETLVHCWSTVEASFADIIGHGYPIINNSGTYLYVCPGGFSKWFADRLDLVKLYENWEAYQILSTTVSIAHPQLKGVESALWSDIYMGMSKYDLFSRVRDQIALVSEKAWYGVRPDGATGEDFLARVESLRNAPGLNPMRTVEAEDGVVLDTSFDNADGITLNGATISGGVLNLDGAGYISLPYKAVGYPWTLSFSLNYSSGTQSSAPLFDGEEGTLYLNYEGTGKIAYARESEIYLLDYVVPTNVWQDITLTCDGNVTRLYVNRVFVAEGKYATASTTNMRSSTFVIPTECIGVGVVGSIDNLKILNTAISHDYMTGADIINYGNVARGKLVSLSGIE